MQRAAPTATTTATTAAYIHIDTMRDFKEINFACLRPIAYPVAGRRRHACARGGCVIACRDLTAWWLKRRDLRRQVLGGHALARPTGRNVHAAADGGAGRPSNVGHRPCARSPQRPASTSPDPARRQPGRRHRHDARQRPSRGGDHGVGALVDHTRRLRAARQGAPGRSLRWPHPLIGQGTEYSRTETSPACGVITSRVSPSEQAGKLTFCLLQKAGQSVCIDHNRPPGRSRRVAPPRI